jgi:hypothetical protein
MLPLRTTKNPTKSLPPFKSCLNAAEMRQNFQNSLQNHCKPIAVTLQNHLAKWSCSYGGAESTKTADGLYQTPIAA